MAAPEEHESDWTFSGMRAVVANRLPGGDGINTKLLVKFPDQAWRCVPPARPCRQGNPTSHRARDPGDPCRSIADDLAPAARQQRSSSLHDTEFRVQTVPVQYLLAALARGLQGGADLIASRRPGSSPESRRLRGARPTPESSCGSVSGRSRKTAKASSPSTARSRRRRSAER